LNTTAYLLTDVFYREVFYRGLRPQTLKPDVGTLKQSAGHKGMLTQTLLVDYIDQTWSRCA
jgi:hypothetical protein